MTTQIGASVHADPTEIRHSIINGTPQLTFGPWPTVNRVDVYLSDTDGIDAVIAHLVALRAEMTGDLPGCICDIASADACKVHRREELHDDEPDNVPAACSAHGGTAEPAACWTCVAAAAQAANPPHRALDDEAQCSIGNYRDRSGYTCTAQDGHDGPDHVAFKPNGGEYHRWPVAAPEAAQAGAEPVSVTA